MKVICSNPTCAATFPVDMQARLYPDDPRWAEFGWAMQEHEDDYEPEPYCRRCRQ
jgi:hypothetical protein